MYYVPDQTKKCGFFECKECGARFLSLQLQEKMPCPYCERDFDPEIGPDEEMTQAHAEAMLVKVIEGEEEVEKWDKLLSLAITGGDEEWL
ncbi:MAG: hypothetical protein E7231_04805 [Cellulosilyticum sp.]|nr:hypothetical protein [Cellulosilyticum sp.]